MSKQLEQHATNAIKCGVTVSRKNNKNKKQKEDVRTLVFFS
jgi:hypothetical protein